jgi:2-polyprenyl-3-methyl-5-hydroxy-6-metoxy-1,4-benzoquinol methylase
MEEFNRKKHWENIYQTKQLHEVSWYQPTPETSLNFINELKIPKNAKIIDIGGGDSFLVDHLLEAGYLDITILDISEAAIERAKIRLGNKADKVRWIIADIADFAPTETYDLWHDRAAFHFLTQPTEIDRYLSAAKNGVSPNGYLLMGTFSDQGPKKCSGIEIKQYNETTMTDLFAPDFTKVTCITVDHPTPFKTSQNFIFGCFRRKLHK